MDSVVSQTNGYKIKPLTTVQNLRGEVAPDRKEEDESNPLLSPRRGGMSKKPKKSRRNVQWNDTNGNKLVEVLEFQPSDASDTDDEDSDSCICSIM